MVKYYSYKEKDSQYCSWSIERQNFAKYSEITTKILTDNGPEFRCEEFDEILSNFNIEHIHYAPQQSSSNGSVERSNRIIIQLTKGVLKDNISGWDLHLHKAILIYNDTIHSQTNSSRVGKTRFFVKKNDQWVFKITGVLLDFLGCVQNMLLKRLEIWGYSWKLVDCHSESQ